MPGFEVIGSEEENEVLDVFRNGAVLFRHGFDDARNGVFKVQEFETEFASAMGVNYALAVSSGTAALRVALASIGLQEGDEVITQSFTFVATVEAIIEARGKPVCTQIDKSLNMCPIDLEKKISSKTKAVIVVHMLGTPANMKEIKRICIDRGVKLIEDTAWGCGGEFQNLKLGTIGDIGTYSFDYAKTMTTGEGGMVVFRNSLEYEKACAWHDHGHENNPNKKRWEDTRSSSGFNFRMMEIQGAIGRAQLKKLSSVVGIQRSNCEKIWTKLKNLEGVTRRMEHEGSNGTADALVIELENAVKANEVRHLLQEKGINTKILPEAITWHFAGLWEHIPELNNGENLLRDELMRSEKRLRRCVALPTSVKFDDQIPQKIYDCISLVLGR